MEEHLIGLQCGGAWVRTVLNITHFHSTLVIFLEKSNQDNVGNFNQKRKILIKFHAVLLCLYVADPANFLASNSVLGTLFSSENSLFIQGKKNNCKFVILSHRYCKYPNSKFEFPFQNYPMPL